MQIKSANNKEVGIARGIAHIRFSELTTLNLGLNNIESIERLCRLSAPLLVELYLCAYLLI